MRTFTTRPEVRIAIDERIKALLAQMVRDEIESAGGVWPAPHEYQRTRADRELSCEPTDPASMKVVVKAAILYHMGLLRGESWPARGVISAINRQSPAFRKGIYGDLRVDLLYLSHLNVLKIQEGEDHARSDFPSRPVDLPDMPERGMPLAYIVLISGITAIQRENIVDCRPYLISITSRDVDPGTWQVTDDLSAQLDGAKTAFETQLPFTPEATRVLLNGLRQQRGDSYAEIGLGLLSGGSISMSFTPYATEELLVTYELGDKENYSGYGITPWGIGLYGV